LCARASRGAGVAVPARITGGRESMLPRAKAVPWKKQRSRIVALVAMCLLACHEASGGEPRYQIPGADVSRGKAAITRYGCGTCHMIPGIDGASGLVGPPLIKWAQRTYIAGEVPNDPAHLMSWLQAPQTIEPGTDMPDLGVSPRDARDIAAYLYTIH
jgi:cytochrome c